MSATPTASAQWAELETEVATLRELVRELTCDQVQLRETCSELAAIGVAAGEPGSLRRRGYPHLATLLEARAGRRFKERAATAPRQPAPAPSSPIIARRL